MKHSVILLLLAATVSCSKPSQQPKAKAPEVLPVASAAPSPKPELPPEIRPTKATGVKEKFVLASLTNNDGLAPKYHHQFNYVMTTEGASPMRVFQDKHSTLKLMVSGSSDDLQIVNLMIPFNDFFGGESGRETGEGAAAFGRCVLRIAMTIGQLMIRGSGASWETFIYKLFDIGLFKVFFTLAVLGFFVWVYVIDIRGR